MYETIKPMGYISSKQQGYSVVKPSYMTYLSKPVKTIFACNSTCRTPVGCSCGRG